MKLASTHKKAITAFNDFKQEIANGDYKGYSFNKVVYVRSVDKTTITCDTHGDFEIQLNNFRYGNRCQKCSRRYQYTTDEWIIEAKKIHGDKFDYFNTTYTKATVKVEVGCRKHGGFMVTPTSHIGLGSGCPKCAGQYTYTTDEWIAKVTELYKGKYDYSKSRYVNASTKVIIICPKHGEFEQTPNGHQTMGCRKCGVEKRVAASTKSEGDAISDFRNIHGDTYDYSKVKYKNNHAQVIITCKEHGDFKQEPSNHLLGNGCPECGVIKRAATGTKSQEEVLLEFKETHGDTYDYSKVKYTKSHNKVIITCKEHGDFEQAPTQHIMGQDCPKCATSASDNDSIYIWKLADTNNYKIGITSSRLGEHRIETVARKMGRVDFTIIIQKKVDGKATDIETLLHKTYKEIPNLGLFDGSTEFRVLSDPQLQECIAVIQRA